MTKRKFGELELQILRILKTGKKTVKQVQALLGEENKYTTVMTVMNRLVEKKALEREKKGLQYIYWLSYAPSEEIPSFIQQFKNKTFRFKTAEMVSFLLEESEDISDDELDAMEKMIQKAREGKKHE